jgi:acyl dehydratase
VQTGFMEGTILAFREINNWKFIKPIFIGDTIHVVVTVRETKAIPRAGGGLITIELDVQNQSEETVMKGNWSALIAGKPE